MPVLSPSDVVQTRDKIDIYYSVRPMVSAAVDLNDIVFPQNIFLNDVTATDLDYQVPAFDNVDSIKVFHTIECGLALANTVAAPAPQTVSVKTNLTNWRQQIAYNGIQRFIDFSHTLPFATIALRQLNRILITSTQVSYTINAADLAPNALVSFQTGAAHVVFASYILRIEMTVKPWRFKK